MFKGLANWIVGVKELQEQITHLEAKLWMAEIQRDLAQRTLEHERSQRREAIFPDYPIYPTYPDLEPMDCSRCGTCGIVWSNATNYVCGRRACPSAIPYCSPALD